ncbi:unnamed protein product [Arabidopsis halleri]
MSCVTIGSVGLVFDMRYTILTDLSVLTRLIVLFPMHHA